jgi:hypothetical protein
VAENGIFISHVHEDDEHVAAMVTLLQERGFEVQTSAIDSSNLNRATNPDYIKREILAPRMEWASTLVVLISPATRESGWVDWEIGYAQEHDKRIVGVWTHGAAECDLPDGLDEYADAVVGWQADRIHGAICGDVDDWEQSDGTRRPVRDIKRFGC